MQMGLMRLIVCVLYDDDVRVVTPYQSDYLMNNQLEQTTVVSPLTIQVV